MSEWHEAPLGKLVDFHNNRRIPLSRIERSKRPGCYRYYGAQGVIDHIDDYIFDGEYLLVAEDGENLRSRRQPIAALVSGQFWVNNHAHIIQSRDAVADNRFLLHAINHAPLSGRVTGVAQPKLTKANLEQVLLPCPSFATQCRIAAVLSTFDELVELNEQRVALLEGLARAVYQEWFVRFRFPGHENVKLVDSELGMIPQGWEVLTASTVFQVNPRIRSKQESYRKVVMGDVDERFSCVLPSATGGRASGSKFEQDDVLMARITPCLENGKTALVKFLESGEVAIGSTEFIVLRGRSVGPAFVYCAARSDHIREHAIKSMSGASGRQRVASDCFDTLYIVQPTLAVALRFESMVAPMLQQVFECLLHNRALAATRDLLLPRLVTGRLDISDVDLGDLLPEEAT